MIERFIYIKPGILTQAINIIMLQLWEDFVSRNQIVGSSICVHAIMSSIKKCFEKNLVLEKMAHVHNSVKCFEYLQGF